MKYFANIYQIESGKWRFGGEIFDGGSISEHTSVQLFDTEEEAKNALVDLCKDGGYELTIK